MSARRLPHISPELQTRITRAVLRWYDRHGRNLPWRNEKEPYRVLVSEIMLQQTQVQRVLLKYPGFLRQFPSFNRLAAARTSDVIKAWAGMGYNNRALRLRRLAQIVLKQYGGRLPRDTQELQSLPGIGRYTAHAIACFSFGDHLPVVDTNIRRILTRVFFARTRTAPGDELLWHLAGHLLPRRSHDWNQALMDLGSSICTASRPACPRCPLVRMCPSAHRVWRITPVSARKEPARDGLPNRIYRGRIIEALRGLKDGSTLSTSKVARIIKPEFTPGDSTWIKSLLKDLQKDGLVQFRSKTHIKLPD